jgi:hypothetical protein
MTHVRTSPYYPQSNGKPKRWHGTLNRDCLRPSVPLSIDEARRLIERFVDEYNHRRLHSALGYVTPADKLVGCEQAIFAARDQKLAAARQRRAARRRQVRWLAACDKEHREEGRGGLGERGLVSPNITRLRGAAASQLGETSTTEATFNSLTPRSENSISR